MKYIKLIDGSPSGYSYNQLKKDNPNTSFPQTPTEELLASYDVYPLTIEGEPEYNKKNKKLVKGSVVNTNGSWVQKWVEEDRNAGDVAYQVRKTRDQLLSSTDYVVLKAVEDSYVSGLPVEISNVWLNYRQALRDITEHVKFPYLDDNDWPNKP